MHRGRDRCARPGGPGHIGSPPVRAGTCDWPLALRSSWWAWRSAPHFTDGPVEELTGCHLCLPRSTGRVANGASSTYRFPARSGRAPGDMAAGPGDTAAGPRGAKDNDGGMTAPEGHSIALSPTGRFSWLCCWPRVLLKVEPRTRDLGTQHSSTRSARPFPGVQGAKCP